MRFVLSLGIVVVMLAPLAGCEGARVRATETFSLSADWNAYQRVVVRTRNGRVHLERGASGSRIGIEGEKSARGATRGEATQNLTQLRVSAHHAEGDASTFVINLDYPETLRDKSIGASINITIPEACAADVVTSNGRVEAADMTAVNARTSNGSVTLERIAGDADIVTSNGRINAVQIGGRLDARTSNGGVHAESIKGDCALVSSNGSVTALDVDGDIELTTSNGSIRLKASPDVDGRVKLNTSNGKIVAELPPDLHGTLSLHTSNGRVHTELDDAVTLSRARWTKWSFDADLNGGGDGVIYARTSNGSISLRCAP